MMYLLMKLHCQPDNRTDLTCFYFQILKLKDRLIQSIALAKKKKKKSQMFLESTMTENKVQETD